MFSIWLSFGSEYINFGSEYIKLQIQMKRSFQEGIRIEGFGEQRFEGLVFEPLFEDLAFKELHRILSDPEWRLG
jgi:hypothetical protein